jgi:hypothetical protein
VAVDEIVLAPRGTVGRTTSGKVQRTALRDRYARGVPLAPPPPWRQPLVVRLLVSQVAYLAAGARRLLEAGRAR